MPDTAIIDALHELREAIQEIIEGPLRPSQRIERLAALDAELAEARAEIAAASGRLKELREAEHEDLTVIILALRDRANTMDSLVAEGTLNELEAADSGVLMNDELDFLENEGILEATAQQLVDDGVIAADGRWLNA